MRVVRGPRRYFTHLPVAMTEPRQPGTSCLIPRAICTGRRHLRFTNLCAVRTEPGPKRPCTVSPEERTEQPPWQDLSSITRGIYTEQRQTAVRIGARFTSCPLQSTELGRRK